MMLLLLLLSVLFLQPRRIAVGSRSTEVNPFIPTPGDEPHAVSGPARPVSETESDTTAEHCFPLFRRRRWGDAADLRRGGDDHEEVEVKS